MKILAVGAHPDDLEILCAGTLARYAEMGHEVTMAHTCRGDKGHFEIPSDELSRIRAREAEESAKLIGAQSIGLGMKDLELWADRDSTMRVVELVRRARPDVILTHDPGDYMPDHTVTSRLVFDASFIATLPHTKTQHPHHDKVTPIYYMETLAGLGFEAEEYVDISGTMETKRRMLRKHESQIEWLKNHDGIDVVDFVETVAKFRGLQCGAAFAEGFRRAHTWPRNPTVRHLP